MAKLDLSIDPPVMNAAGTLGFFPDGHESIDWNQLGAFITNPISMVARTPARGVRFINYPGGFLLHTGYPNPGFLQALRRYSLQWRRSSIPVIVHLLAREPDEMQVMVQQLESVEGVSGLELGVAEDITPEMMSATIQSARGELPVIARLPMERALELAPVALQADVMAVSLAPPRGRLPAQGGEVVAGRLYGPAIFPASLRVVHELVGHGIPTIGGGGLRNRELIDRMLAEGALAVQLDFALWRRCRYQVVS